MNPTIQFIYFDLGNVLLFFDHDRGCRQIAAVCGLPAEQVHKAIFGSSLNRDYETGTISSQQFVNTFCELTQCEPTPDELLLAFNDIFWLNRQIVPLISQLTSIGFPIGILSNTCQAHWQFAASAKFIIIQQCFDKRVLSFESGSMKPEGKIYRDAIALAGVPAGKILFVDDRPENVQGAIRAGIDAHVFTSVGDLCRLLYQRGIRLNL